MWISELRYQDAATKTYLGSPSIVRLPDGALLASHDYFGPGGPVSREGFEHLASIYRSEDDGLSWTNVNHVTDAFWSGLFVREAAVYLVGCSGQYGDIVIRRSDDGGLSWSRPLDDSTGVLFRGGKGRDAPNYHCAPVPILIHDGRMYRAFEDNSSYVWGPGFDACVISAPADADLLRADSWMMSNKLPYDQATDPPEFGVERNGAGWLEGNVVADPDGRLWNILRVSCEPVYDKAAMVQILDGGTRIEFDPEGGFIDFPGGSSKFTIRRDEETGLYWSLVNDMSHHPGRHCRNTLLVTTSEELRTWTGRATLLQDNLEVDAEKSIMNTGFHYVDWQFDGDDIIYLSRTSYNGAHSYHDSNRITFSIIRDFRKLRDRVL